VRRSDSSTHRRVPLGLAADVRAHRRQAAVLVAAVGVIGVTFGVLADSAGLSIPKVAVVSALVFTGASQFAAVGVVAGGGTSLAAFGSAMILAARNTLYGPVVDRALPPTRIGRLAASHFVIDETAAMAASQSDPDMAKDAFWFTGVWLWALWLAGSIAGAVLGSFIGDPSSWGLDAAFPASFVALISPHVRTSPARFAALLGAGIAVATVPWTPAGVPLLLAALAVIPASRLQGTFRGGTP